MVRLNDCARYDPNGTQTNQGSTVMFFLYSIGGDSVEMSSLFSLKSKKKYVK